jgi:hypothetical protein
LREVRQSARLAAKPAITTVQKAQRNLYNKLGIGDNERMTTEEVLRDFVAMF